MSRVHSAMLLAVLVWVGGAAAETVEEADARVLALLDSYEVGTTTYLTFSQDFDLSLAALTQSSFGERKPPTSGRIGIIGTERAENRGFKGPDGANLAAEIMASLDSGKVSPEINPYMGGAFLFGYQNNPAEKTMYVMTPELFTVVARLRFLNGVLAEKVMTTKGGTPP